MSVEDVCRHEAGHACAAALLGLSVRLVDTTSRTYQTSGGGLCTVYGETRHDGEPEAFVNPPPGDPLRMRNLGAGPRWGSKFPCERFEKAG